MTTAVYRGFAPTAGYHPLNPSKTGPQVSTQRAQDANAMATTRLRRIVTHDNIPPSLLGKPADNAVWQRCIIRAYTLDCWKYTFEDIPGIHIVGEISTTGTWEVAICEPCVEWLTGIDFPFVTTKPKDHYDVAYPTHQNRCIENARKAILSTKHGRGLHRYYHDHAHEPSFSTAISWILVYHDIQHLETSQFQRFCQHCVVIALHSLDDLQDAYHLPMMHWANSKWLSFFEKLCMDGSSGLLFDLREERQDVALLHGVLKSVSDRNDLIQFPFDDWYSAKDNLDKLGCLLDFSLRPNSVPFGSLQGHALNRVLLQCKVFQGSIDGEWAKPICQHIPVASLDQEQTPACLIHLTPRKILDNRHISFRGASLASNDDMTLLRLSQYFRYRFNPCAVDVTIIDWLKSPQGKSLYHKTLISLADNATIELVALRLLALISYHRILPQPEDQTTNPIHGSFIWDFMHVVKGEPINSGHCVIERMAMSIRRLARSDCFFGAVDDAPLHLLDGLSDMYWGHRFHGMSHTDASMAIDEGFRAVFS